MKNDRYWAERMRALEDALLDTGYEYVRNLEQQYDLAIREVEAQMAVWYQRLAKNNGISLAEARRLLTADELEEFHWTVEEYIRHGQENAISKQWMKQLENASSRVHISRLDSLRLRLQQQAEALHGRQNAELDALLREIYANGYYRTAFEIQRGLGVGWSLHGITDDEIRKALARPWAVDGKVFSDRIWANKEGLVNSINTQLTQMIMRGQAPDQAIKAIAERFGVSKSQAGRLVMTESAALANEARKDCFNDLDVEEYIIVETLDKETCPLCGQLDGKVFKMSEYAVGLTAPPFHPWCRGTTAPYFADMQGVGERLARGADGKTYTVPKDMTYAEWYAKQTDENGRNWVDVERKKWYNEAADRAQYKRYKALLGDKAPKTFAAFQKVKYSDEYASLKLQYADARIQDRIKTGKISTSVLAGKQGKHILGHSNYIEGRSYLNSGEDAQVLVNKYAGTGTILRDASGKWAHKEVVKADHPIGFAVSQFDGSVTETSVFTIHYSKKGVHIVPKKEE